MPTACSILARFDKLASSGTPPSTSMSNPHSDITASTGTAWRPSRSLSNSARTLSRDSVASPARAAMQATSPVVIGQAVAVMRMETEEAQDAQIILGDARGRIADEADAPLVEIGEPAGIVVDRAVARDRQRVDGEVAPLGVFLPVAAERHPRLAPEGLDILAQRRDLERPPVDHDCDGAVLDSRRNGLEALRLRAPRSLRRARRWWRRRSRRSARRAAHCAPRRRPRALPRRRCPAPRAAAPACLRAAIPHGRGAASVIACGPERICRLRYAPAHRSSRAARRKNARTG